MTILLDSHAIVWYLAGDRRMSNAARSAIERDPQVYVSPVSAFEIANKHRLGKWPQIEVLARDFVSAIDGYQWLKLPLSLEHAHLAGRFPADHHDPFDRMLAAQSQAEDIPLVTADPAFRAFGTRTLW